MLLYENEHIITQLTVLLNYTQGYSYKYLSYLNFIKQIEIQW